MTNLKKDLPHLIREADRAIDDRQFWRLLWVYASAYSKREKALLRGFVAQWGVVPEAANDE
jgi:hypothetical protein